jgi:hypothetical protein
MITPAPRGSGAELKIEEKIMISELQFNCSAVTQFVYKTVPDWKVQLQAGQQITSGLVGDSDLQVTLLPSSVAEGTATLFRGKNIVATVPYCIDRELNVNEGWRLCIGITFYESRRMTKRMQDIERQRSMLIEQYGRINEGADNALDLASRATMSGPYRRRARGGA